MSTFLKSALLNQIRLTFLIGAAKTLSKILYQTGKYVVRAPDLPRASKVPCAQRPIKRAEFEKYT